MIFKDLVALFQSLMVGERAAKVTMLCVIIMKNNWYLKRFVPKEKIISQAELLILVTIYTMHSQWCNPLADNSKYRKHPKFLLK